MSMTPTAKMISGGSKCMPKRLEGIKEDNEVSWLPTIFPQPETPTESMEFLARSWSLSAMELSKALIHTNDSSNHVAQSTIPFLGDSHDQVGSSKEQKTQPLLTSLSPPSSPRASDDQTEQLLLHEALNPEITYNQQQLKTGQLYRNNVRGKTMGRRIKDQKERKKQEMRTQTAQLHAAVSVAGVAAAVAALAASSVTSAEKTTSQEKKSIKMSAAIASAAALVASHCIDIAEDMGADHDHLLSVISSAINVKSNGDMMTLTAGAATALRGAATLRARMRNCYTAPTMAIADEHNMKEANMLHAMDFVSQGGELLKRTRKGDLHWKVVSVNINSDGQVVAKMKSKHMAGTFTKKKKYTISGVYADIPRWTAWDREETDEQLAYFGVQSADRIIELGCRNRADKQIWIEGIEHMLHFRANMP